MVDPNDWQRICSEHLAVTSYDRATLDAIWEDRSYDPKTRPETYLTYPDALARHELGEPEPPRDAPSLWEVVAARRSKRNYLDQPLTLNQLNLLLWSGQGITGDKGDYQLRTAPSSGALYPIETFLFVQRVEGLEPGLYHLDVRGWALEALRLGDLSDTACELALDQEHVRRAGVTFLWTAVMSAAGASTTSARIATCGGTWDTWPKTSTSRPRPSAWGASAWTPGTTARPTSSWGSTARSTSAC